MQFVRSLMGWVAVVSGVLVLAPTVGCKKKDDAKTEEAKADDEGGKKKGGGDDYATGDVLKHVPSSCKAGRIYLNVSKLLKNEAIQDSASALQEKLVDSMGKSDSKKASKALKSLKKSGIDVTKDVKEIALCMEETKGDPVVAIGGNFAGKDPIGAIVKAADESGDKEFEKKESDGVDYIKDGKQYVAAVAPNVIVFTRDKDSFSDLKKDGDVSDDWNAGKGRIVAFTVKEKKSGTFTGTITESGDDLEVKFTGEFSGNTGEEIEDNPKQFKKQLEMMQDKLASKLKKGPFKKIADDIGNAKIKVSDNTVTVTATIPADDIGDSIKKAVDASDEDLKAAIDL